MPPGGRSPESTRCHPARVRRRPNPINPARHADPGLRRSLRAPVPGLPPPAPAFPTHLRAPGPTATFHHHRASPLLVFGKPGSDLCLRLGYSVFGSREIQPSCQPVIVRFSAECPADARGERFTVVPWERSPSPDRDACRRATPLLLRDRNGSLLVVATARADELQLLSALELNGRLDPVLAAAARLPRRRDRRRRLLELVGRL